VAERREAVAEVDVASLSPAHQGDYRMCHEPGTFRSKESVIKKSYISENCQCPLQGRIYHHPTHPSQHDDVCIQNVPVAAVPTIKAKHQGLRRLAAREAVETVVGQSSGM
jgi:hypothetical protein